ncbi:MAG: ACP S-malonyltransferase [Thioalkalispiraceae bacterium]|jgi:[acyl-carrier-protein] S-malonyltransferase
MSLAFVFPGQGSQSIGMLDAFAEVYPQVKTTFAEASSVLSYDLWQVVSSGPENKLNSTDVTQPAMLAAGVAIWRLWQEKNGEQPSYLAGHSLGEYTALVCAGVVDFTEAIKLVAARGQYMQDAVPAGTGAMAAILGLDDAAVRAVCEQASTDQIVEAVNFNSPGQVVIAGHANAVEKAAELAKENGAKRAVILPVSVPSHCQLMKPAADKLAVDLEVLDLAEPVIPVINNVDVTSETSAQAIKDALIRQLYQPVRWVEIIQTMAEKGVDRIIECGPGKVLMGLNKRIDKSLTHAALTDPAALDSLL